MKKNLERQRQLRDQKRALSPKELALALEELRHNVVAPSLEAKAKQDKEQMKEEEIDEEAELPQD